MNNQIKHPFKPYYNKNSKILILGSFPSIKSRKECFYYMHPQNRFWKVLSYLFNEQIPISIKEKKEFLCRHNIALWDVIKTCEIIRSSDSSIKNIQVNNLNTIIKSSNIKYIFTTGKKAYELYNKYCLNDTGIKAHYLLSPSPANCAVSFEKLVNNYKQLLI